MTLMRPSMPARNLLALLNYLCRSCSSRSTLFFLPALGKHTFLTPISFAARSFSFECTLRSAATSSGALPNKRRVILERRVQHGVYAALARWGEARTLRLGSQEVFVEVVYVSLA
jgi:hypothetical protein